MRSHSRILPRSSRLFYDKMYFTPAQLLKVCLPDEDVVIPCGQGVHESELECCWYVPAGHGSQGDVASSRPFDENVPGLHCAKIEEKLR